MYGNDALNEPTNWFLLYPFGTNIIAQKGFGMIWKKIVNYIPLDPTVPLVPYTHYAKVYMGLV